MEEIKEAESGLERKRLSELANRSGLRVDSYSIGIFWGKQNLQQKPMRQRGQMRRLELHAYVST